MNNSVERKNKNNSRFLYQNLYSRKRLLQLIKKTNFHVLNFELINKQRPIKNIEVKIGGIIYHELNRNNIF